MGLPAAKQGDMVLAVDIHILMIPTPAGPVPTPLPHVFLGMLDGSLSTDVNIMSKPAAVLGSQATNNPAHVPMGPGPFQVPPTNKGTVTMGSPTVMINGKPAARLADTVTTCNDPAPAPVGLVVAFGTVLIG